MTLTASSPISIGVVLPASCVFCVCCAHTRTQVDTYIKAFYLPWEELPRWAQVHVAEVGRARVVSLAEAMAEAYGIRRSAKVTLLERLQTALAEFG